MKELLLKSNYELAALVLRLTAAIIMFPHGAQKLLGLFGGYGFKNTMEYFTTQMKLPSLIALLVIIIEFFGPLCLAIGLYSKLSALALIAVMVGAICTVNFKNGLFMNWNGTQAGEGCEYHFLYIGICIAIILTGSGKYAIDRYLP